MVSKFYIYSRWIPCDFSDRSYCVKHTEEAGISLTNENRLMEQF